MKIKSGCEGVGPKHRPDASHFFYALSAAALAVSIWTLGVVRAGAQETSVRDGVYTEAQADRGADIFSRSCAGCHETDRFIGEQMEPWMNQSAYRFFRAVRLTMPEEDPGSLTRQQYADIVAYIIKLNGFKPGSDELQGTDDAMRAVLLESFPSVPMP